MDEHTYQELMRMALEKEKARLKAQQLSHMAIYNGPPRTWTTGVTHPVATPTGPQVHPDTYSICEIQVDGGMVPFTVKASPSLLQHAITQMKETGFLYLWNDSESLCIRASEVRALRMVKMTTEG